MEYIAIDIETKKNGAEPDPYLDPLLILSFVASDGREGVFLRNEVPQWILEVLEDPSVLKLIHHASFEAMFLKHNFGKALKNVWDTLAVERALTAGTSVSCDLASVADRRLGIRLDKSVRAEFGNGLISDRGKEYCLQDSRVLPEIYKQQKEIAKKNGQLYVAELESLMAVVAGYMQLSGIDFDVDLWHKYVPMMEEKRAAAERLVWDYLGVAYSEDIFGGVSGGVPLSCTDRVLNALRQKGIDLSDYQSSTLETYLYSDVPEEKKRIVSGLLEFKRWDKAVGWDYPKFIHPVTGRIHAKFNPQGADTLRFSCSDPNLQQVTRPFGGVNFRNLFIAGPGHRFVGADYSQIELRILANESEEPSLLRAFLEGEDLHALAAEAILGRPIRDKSERNLGKVYNFGVRAYGGGPDALIGSALEYGIVMSQKDAKTYIARMKKADKQVEAWANRMYEKMTNDGYIQTPMGHRRYISGGKARPTVARNTPIQMFAAGIAKEAIKNLVENIDKAKVAADLVLVVHDEIVLRCQESEAEKLRCILEESMVQAGNSWLKKVPCLVDSYISERWEK